VKYDVVLAPSVRIWMRGLEFGERQELLLAIQSELRLNDPRTREVPGKLGTFVREILGYHVYYRGLKELEKERYALRAGYMVLAISDIDGFPLKGGHAG